MTHSESYFTNKGPLQSNSLKNQAYQQIKDAVLYRRIQTGKVYSQDDFCNELGISRTPVREALIALQSEGFIKFVRGRGFQVVEITRKEALDIIELRRNIEAFGTELAAERITEQQLVQLRRTYEDMVTLGKAGDSSALYRKDYDFHAIIFEATGNSWLIDLNKKIRENFLRIENQCAFTKRKFAAEVFKEHERILLSLEERNPKKAIRAMQLHMKHTAHRTLINVLGEE